MNALIGLEDKSRLGKLALSSSGIAQGPPATGPASPCDPGVRHCSGVIRSGPQASGMIPLFDAVLHRLRIPSQRDHRFQTNVTAHSDERVGHGGLSGASLGCLASPHGAGHGCHAFLLKERLALQAEAPMLSLADLVMAINQLLPRPEPTPNRIASIIHERHRRRQDALAACLRRESEI